jgi:hypothetical protein
LHERVLELDPANAMSRSELRYIERLKQRAPKVRAPDEEARPKERTA